MNINQAVLFTKPVHHLDAGLNPVMLDEMLRAHFERCGFSFVQSREVTGSELARRNIIPPHYFMYSSAALAERYPITDSGKQKFEVAFGKSWDAELAAGKIMPTAELLESRGIDVHELFSLWNDLYVGGKTVKIQDGMIAVWIPELEAYCINGFYPAMEANFYHLETRIFYHVIEFDPGDVSWFDFRKKVLGKTDASKADPESFRRKLYAEYPVKYPGRDNYVHGSAGPFEALVERAIHEEIFDFTSNPIGQYLSGRGLTLELFRQWKKRQSVSALGSLFDQTEEKNGPEISLTLDQVEWVGK